MYVPALIAAIALAVWISFAPTSSKAASYGPAHDGWSRDLSDAKLLIPTPEDARPAVQERPLVLPEEDIGVGEGKKKGKKKAKKGESIVSVNAKKTGSGSSPVRNTGKSGSNR